MRGYSKFLGIIIFINTVGVFAKSINYTYNFENVKIEHFHDYEQVLIENLPLSIDRGKPKLPFKTVRILIPDNVGIANIMVERTNITELNGIKNLKLSTGIQPYSYIKDASFKLTPTGSFIGNKIVSIENLEFNRSYPEALTYYSTQRYHGFNILVATIHPAFIRNAKLYVAKKIKIHLNIIDSKNQKNKQKKLIYLKEVLNEIDIYKEEDVCSYFKGSPELNGKKCSLDEILNSNVKGKSVSRGDYDYLILTAEDFINSAQTNKLLEYKNFIEVEYGLKVQLKDVSKLIASHNGRDKAEKLRNAIREEYYEHDIKYLLLVGDSNSGQEIVPVRYLYSEVLGYNGSWEMIREHIASDFYYSCLDGSFNSDDDDKWGEPNDGENGEDVDFMCELVVSRWSVLTNAQLKKIIEKTLLYYSTQNREKNVLFLGESLFNELNLWGGDYLDKLIGEVYDHGFTSYGYDDTWSYNTLYDKDRKWKGSEAQDIIARGNYLMVNHLGHSSAYMNMRLYGFVYNGLGNSKPYFYYSQGCNAGDFTTKASIIEKMLYSNGGPVAAVANSNYGLGPEDPDASSTDTPGTSQILHRFFVDRILNNNVSFAEAHKESKKDITVYIEHQEARWVIWAATFFGDPVMKLQ